MTNQEQHNPLIALADEQHEAEKSFSESYVTRLGDFTKWTTTLAIAATLWITNSLTDYPMSFRLPAIISLVLLSISLLSSLGIGAMILYIEKKRWQSSRMTHQIILSLIVETGRQGPSMRKPVDPKTLERMKDKRDRDRDKSSEANRAARKALQIVRSWVLFLIHLGALFLGVTAYAGLQVYHVLTFTSPLSP